jgi:hypothetical protein
MEHYLDSKICLKFINIFAISKIKSHIDSEEKADLPTFCSLSDVSFTRRIWNIN